MKNKRILKGMLGFALVFGLGAILANCDVEPGTAGITVTNNSPYSNDSTVTVRVYMPGRGDPLEALTCSKDQSVTFSVDTGEYQVRVTGGGGSFYFPQDASYIKLSNNESVKLNYNGNLVTRTN